MAQHASLTESWWVPVIRGLCAIVFGVLAFVVPGLTFGALVLLFGVYAVIEGAFSVGAALTGRQGQRSWWTGLLGGLVSIIAGIAAFTWPGFTAITLVYLIAFWAILIGLLQVIAAVELRREISGEWLLGLGGVLSVVFGLAVMAYPFDGALAMVFLIGAYAIVYGASLVAAGVTLRHTRAMDHRLA